MDTDGLISTSSDKVCDVTTIHALCASVLLCCSFRHRDASALLPISCAALLCLQTVVSLPCYDLSSGDTMSFGASKTVAVYSFDGSVTLADPISGTYDVDTSPGGYSGMRQATTVNGSGFWMSGEAAAGSGFRYLPSLSAGATETVGGASDTEPGYYDARGVTVFNGQLYGCDSTADGGFGGASWVY